MLIKTHTKHEISRISYAFTNADYRCAMSDFLWTSKNITSPIIQLKVCNIIFTHLISKYLGMQMFGISRHNLCPVYLHEYSYWFSNVFQKFRDK